MGDQWLDASTEHRQLNESRVYDANRKAVCLSQVPSLLSINVFADPGQNEKSVSWSKDSAKCDFRPNEGPLTPSVLAKEFPIYSRSETICGDLRWATQTGAQIRDCIVPEVSVVRMWEALEPTSIPSPLPLPLPLHYRQLSIASRTSQRRGISKLESSRRKTILQTRMIYLGIKLTTTSPTIATRHLTISQPQLSGA